MKTSRQCLLIALLIISLTACTSTPSPEIIAGKTATPIPSVTSIATISPTATPTPTQTAVPPTSPTPQEDTAPPADGAPSTGGTIAFYSDRDGNPEIYTMNADGSGAVRLTNDPAFDDSPAISPDGTQIAFLTARHDPSPSFPDLKYET